MGEFISDFFLSSTADPMGNAAPEDPEKRLEPRPLTHREAQGLLLPGPDPLHRQPSHLPLALLRLPGTCSIGRIGKVLSAGCTQDAPTRNVPAHPKWDPPWQVQSTPRHSLLSPLPLGKVAPGPDLPAQPSVGLKIKIQTCHWRLWAA